MVRRGLDRGRHRDRNGADMSLCCGCVTMSDRSVTDALATLRHWANSKNMREAVARVEAEIARQRNERAELEQRMDEEIVAHGETEERAEAAEAEITRLRNGLQRIWDLPPGEHLNRARDIARANLKPRAAGGA